MNPNASMCLVKIVKTEFCIGKTIFRISKIEFTILQYNISII